MVTYFCDRVVAVGSVFSSSRDAAVTILSSFCGSDMLVLVLVGFVLAIVVADDFG